MKDFTNNLSLSPPIPKINKKIVKFHGYDKIDNYSWMRADNWQEVMKNPEKLPKDIKLHLDKENNYTKEMMADTLILQDNLYTEIRSRMQEKETTVPQKNGIYSYYYSYKKNNEYPIYNRKNNDTKKKTILLDYNKISKDESYFNIGSTTHSEDHRYITYGVDTKGSEYFDIYLFDTINNQILNEKIENSTGTALWAKDNLSFLYVRLDENHRPDSVFYHLLGTPQKEDVMLYKEKDSGFFLSIDKTQSSKYFILSSHTHEKSEIRLIDTNNPLSESLLLYPRENNYLYSVEENNNELYILTNQNNCVDFSIIKTRIPLSDKKDFKVIVPHKNGRLIKNLCVFKNYIVWLEVENSLPKIIIKNLKSDKNYSISFREEAYSLGILQGYEYETNILRFVYSSMTTPMRIYDFNMEKNKRTLIKSQKIPSGHKKSDYITKRIYAESSDKKLIPISLIYHKNTKIDATSPCLLYGYGAYGISIPASFSSSRLSLIDRNFVYAVAHIRGGKDCGSAWYSDGKKENKINTFNDFICVAEYLCKKNYTSKGNIIAHGGSAGGMLMGAIANMAPSLFSGIIAEVPFVDVLETMLDSELPLTPPEWPEWGNPITNIDDYKIISSYSPYDNVKKQSYPNILATAGLTDPRVTYWEPAKWVAKIRSMKTNKSAIMLNVNMDSGHGGSSGRFDRIKEIALIYAFAIKAANVETE